MNDKASKETILLVEDEESLAIGLEFNLTEEGYIVVVAEDGAKALEKFEQQSFDIIILDIMLPFYNGFEITEIIRKKNPQMPILMLTARTDVEDRVQGLAIGADDYMTKPFHLKELLERVRGMLRRKQWYKEITEGDDVFHFGDNWVNFKDLSCKSGDKHFRLTPLEAMVMKHFVDHKSQVVTRQELLENVWNVNAEMETRTVDNFIMHLRKYFEVNPSRPQYIKSVRGKGYIFSDKA